MNLFIFAIIAIAYAWLAIIWIRVNSFLESVDNLLKAHNLLQNRIDGLHKTQYQLLSTVEFLQRNHSKATSILQTVCKKEEKKKTKSKVDL